MKKMDANEYLIMNRSVVTIICGILPYLPLKKEEV